MTRHRSTYTACPRHADGDPTCVMQDAAMLRVFRQAEPAHEPTRSAVLQIIAASVVSAFFVWVALVLLTSVAVYP